LLAEFRPLVTQSSRHGFAFKVSKIGDTPVLIITDETTVPELSHLRFFTIEPARSLTDLFERQTVFSHYLVTTNGQVAVGPGGLIDSALSALTSTSLVDDINAKKFRSGALLTSSAEGASLLASYSFVEGADAFILSLAPASAVYRAAIPLLLKTSAAILALLAVAALASMVLAQNLTTSVNALRAAMKKFGEGDVETQLEPTSNDEIGELTLYFNSMTTQIKTLLRLSSEKAQIEMEMETAKRVQDTLFPPGLARLGPVEFAGFFEPASKCGGDWWYYFVRDEKLYLLIGDVTGHGVPAALLTSAARSALSLIEAMPVGGSVTLEPATILELLNKSVYDTAKGQMQMTFCVGALDFKSGRLTIANASHETPILLPRADSELKREDLRILESPLCVRLGENRDAKFEQETHQLEPGDRVLFYSDGLLDVRNNADDVWPERELYKALAAACSTEQAPERAIVLLREKMELFRNKRALNDDLSFFLISYGG
jgi:sigma-B regulation protein RsbU (phosphoserine phosphatase)